MMMKATPKCIALCNHLPAGLGSQDIRLCSRLFCYACVVSDKAMRTSKLVEKQCSYNTVTIVTNQYCSVLNAEWSRCSTYVPVHT
mgnify:CR=1 FL=1